MAAVVDVVVLAVAVPMQTLDLHAEAGSVCGATATVSVVGQHAGTRETPSTCPSGPPPSGIWEPTVPAFNSCTKCVVNPGIIDSRTHDCHPVSWANERTVVALIRKLRGSLMCLAYFLTYYSGGFVQPGTSRRSVDWCRNEMSSLYSWTWNYDYRSFFFHICIYF